MKDGTASPVFGNEEKADADKYPFKNSFTFPDNLSIYKVRFNWKRYALGYLCGLVFYDY